MATHYFEKVFLNKKFIPIPNTHFDYYYFKVWHPSVVEVVCFWMIFIHPSSFDETFHYFVIIRDLWYYISIGHQPETSLISQHNNFTMGWNTFWVIFLRYFFQLCLYYFANAFIRGCQISMQGPQLCAGPCHFCKLDVPSSRLAFLDLKLHVLQLGTSNSNNWGCPVVQNCTSDTP